VRSSEVLGVIPQLCDQTGERQGIGGFLRLAKAPTATDGPCELRIRTGERRSKWEETSEMMLQKVLEHARGNCHAHVFHFAAAPLCGKVPHLNWVALNVLRDLDDRLPTPVYPDSTGTPGNRRVAASMAARTDMTPNG